MSRKGQEWQYFKPRLSIFKNLPYPVFMKAKDLPAKSSVIEHKHDWDQLIYAVSGLLEVSSIRGKHLIPPGQGVWIPANEYHSIATYHGAKLRSVHVEKGLIEQFNQDIDDLGEETNSLVEEIEKWQI